MHTTEKQELPQHCRLCRVQFCSLLSDLHFNDRGRRHSGGYLNTYICCLLIRHRPYFLGTLVLPVFEDKIPHLLTILLTFGFDLCGIIFLAAFESKEAKLGGICLISLGSAFADVGFLSLTALYGEVTVRGYATGTGIGFAAAVIYYAGRVIRNQEASSRSYNSSSRYLFRNVHIDCADPRLLNALCREVTVLATGKSD